MSEILSIFEYVASDFSEESRKAMKLQIAASIEDGFGGRLVQGYMEREFDHIHLMEEDGRIIGGYIMIPNKFGIAFLSKIWIIDDRKGRGLGRSLWADMISRYPAVFWRSLRSNPACDWYKDNCEGYTKYQHRNIYWIDPYVEDISKMILWAFNQPFDVEKGS